jgi:nitroreductase
MTQQETRAGHPGLSALAERRFLDVLSRRRTHRVSRGSSVPAGTMSYESSQPREALTELEEAVLIAVTGATGLTMPDRPFNDPRDGSPIMAKPNLTMAGRTAGSPDNAQGTYFFLINDSGTYFLRKLPPVEDGRSSFDPELLVARAEAAKVKLLDHRIDVPDGNRDFPAYLDSNRFLSNLPGTTVLFPVVDLSRQYINGLMYLLTQPPGARPTIVDDRNFYRPAGVKRWVRKGFLNEDIKLPLGAIWGMRTQIEADLLLQNLMLTAEAMGLGAWIHGTISPPVMLGDPKFRDRYGPMLDFDWVIPKWKPVDILRWQVPLPRFATLRAHPVGLRHDGEHLIQAMCPPNYPSMAAAVDAVIADKFGPQGIYTDPAVFRRIYKGDFGTEYLHEASDYPEDVIDCARDICTYVHETHGRFPAHVEALHVPGVWLQAHHVEQPYYERFFRGGLTEAHLAHDRTWHPVP